MSNKFQPSPNQQVYIIPFKKKGVVKSTNSTANESFVTYFDKATDRRINLWISNSNLRPFKDSNPKQEKKESKSLIKLLPTTQDLIDGQKKFWEEVKEKGENIFCNIEYAKSNTSPTVSVARLKVKKLSPNAIIPKYQTEGAAGFDLHAAEDVYILPGETKIIKTDLAFEIPVGYELRIQPRSGVTAKTKLRVANSPGCIDSDYRGNVGIIMDNTHFPFHKVQRECEYANVDINNKTIEKGEPLSQDISVVYDIKVGDRIAQAIISPVARTKFVESDELSETKRGSGGFGHSGTK